MTEPNFIPYKDPRPEFPKDAPVPESPDPLLESGTRLPRLWTRKVPSRLIATPLHEVDPYYAGQNTFVFLTKSHVLRRYTARPVLWKMGPSSPLRLFSLRVSTHFAFAFFLNLAVLVNCILLVTSGNPLAIQVMMYIFLVLYILEALVKILSQGLLFAKFTYFRSGWNVLDFLVILIWIIGLLQGFEFYGLRFFRLIKIMGIFSGYRPLVRTLERSLKNMGNVLIVVLTFAVLYAVLGMELFSGAFRRKCVFLPNITEDIVFEDYAQDSENWFKFRNSYPGCWNHSKATACPDSHACIYIDDPMANPNYGYTTFDSYGYALLSTIQLMMGDFWENLFYTVISSTGHLMILFFYLPLLMLLYLTGMMIGVVYTEYSSAVQIQKSWEAANQEQETPDVKDDSDSNTGEETDKKDDSTAVEMTGLNESEKKQDSEGEEFEDADKLLQAQLKSLLSRILKAICLWICCWCCEKTIKKFQDFVFHPYIELFFHVCIVLNTVVSALDHHDMGYELDLVLSRWRVVLISIFFAEIILKISALGPMDYFKYGMNLLDATAVLLSFLGIFVRHLHGFSALLVFRIYHVLPRLPLGRRYRRLVFTLWKMFGPFRRMILLHLVMLLGFAFIGNDLICSLCYEKLDEPIPRFNFADLWHSFLSVFRVFSEEWVELLWDCMQSGGGVTCIPFFLVAAVVLHLIVFNIFVAIALREFCGGAEESESPPSYIIKDTKLGQFCLSAEKKMVALKNVLLCKRMNEVHPPLVTKSGEETEKVEGHVNGASTALEEDGGAPTDKENEGGRSAVKSVAVEIPIGKSPRPPPPDCCPDCCYRWVPANNRCEEGCEKIRQAFFRFISHVAFKVVIGLVVIASFIALGVEKPGSSPEYWTGFHIADIIFTTIFLAEMVAKWIGKGMKSYFSSGWCLLEFFVVVMCLYSEVAFAVGTAGQRKFRIVRALRIFWIPSKLKILRGIHNTLKKSTWSLFLAALLCLLILLPFAILGVQAYGGRFYMCVDGGGDKIDHHQGMNITNKTVCMMTNNTWARSEMNFDDVLESYLSLLSLATFKGWVDIFINAADSVELDSQPRKDANVYSLWLLIIFIWFSALFCLQLFLCILREAYDKEIKVEEDAGLSGDKLLLYRSLKKAVSYKPKRIVPKPLNPLLTWFYTICTSPTFDFVMLAVILAYCVTRAFASADLDPYYQRVLVYLTLATILIFVLEFVAKLLGLRSYYFRDPWNIFELLVVLVSIVDLSIVFPIFNFDVAGLLRFLRITKLWQLRWDLHTHPRLQMLGSVLCASLPHLLGNALVQLLLLFVYVILGMALFGDADSVLEYNVASFGSFVQGEAILFPLTTSAGWDGVLFRLPSPEEPYTVREILYVVSFVVINIYVFMKLHIAIILNRYRQAEDDLEKGLIEGDIVRYYRVWKQFNPNGSYYMPLEFVPQLLDSLEYPLRVPKPNETTIDTMDLPVYKNNTVFCQDLLVACVRHFFSSKGISFDGVPDPVKKYGALNKEKIYSVTVDDPANSDKPTLSAKEA